MKNHNKLPEEGIENETNEYDNDLVDKGLWDHYSGLPNPNWYDDDNWDGSIPVSLNNEK